MARRSSLRLLTSERGMTLVEMMVAIALGLVVVAAVGSAYVQGVRSHAQDNNYTSMLLNGNYAMQSLRRDLEMLGFWGDLASAPAVPGTLAAGEDCGMGVFDPTTPLLVNNPGAGATTFDVSGAGCQALFGTLAAGSGQIAIKRVQGSPQTAGQSDGIAYVRTNGVEGAFTDSAASDALGPGDRDWRYSPRLYFIRDVGGVPTLCRLDLAGNGFGAVANDACLAPGVERLHVQVGIDTTGDGVANRYSATPTVVELQNAVTARLWLLVRAENADPTFDDSQQRTYQLGDLAVNVQDQFYRRVFSTTVVMRNVARAAWRVDRLPTAAL